MAVPDRFERRIEVGAPRERVWAALTEPAQLVRWFPTHEAEVDLRVGGEMRFGWEESADEAVIEALEPPERFVFRWRPRGTDRPHTTVTIVLRETADGGTDVTLIESGFASLPDQIHEQSYESNAKGWAEELAELQAYVEGSGLEKEPV
jgi:uncharacterized protein YndB with AHSA1/START domain